MKQKLPQEEVRRIIITDMVKKRNSIVPIIGDDVIVYKGKDSLEEIPFQEFYSSRVSERISICRSGKV